MSKEIILLQGFPGSGKSSAAARLSESYVNLRYDHVGHYSIGNHLRGITDGSIESDQTAHIVRQSKVLAGSQRLEDHVVNEVVKEHLTALPAQSLTIIDAYPLYVEQIPEFQKNVAEIGASVLGIIDIEIDPTIALSRIIQRGTRSNEDDADTTFAQRRLDEHKADCLPTTAALGMSYTNLRVDGSLTSLEVVAQLSEAVDMLTLKEIDCR